MIAILDYGMGNLRSVARAIAQVGGRGEVTSDPAQARRADAMVVPGVGAFGACMRGLRLTGLDAVVRELAAGARPVLGVCLGMQVLFESSEEDEDPGLGLVPADDRSERVGAAGRTRAFHLDLQILPETGPYAVCF